MKPDYIIIFAILFLLSGLYLYQVSQYQYPGWDCAVYMLNAEDWLNLGKHSLYENFRSPLLSWFISGLWIVTGISFGSAKWLSAIFMVASSWVLFLLVQNMKGRWFALFVTVLTMLNPYLFLYTTQLYTESLSLFFLLLIIYFMYKHRPILAGICLGLAFASRYFMSVQGVAIIAGSVLVELQLNWNNKPIIQAAKVGAVALAVIGLVIGAVYLKTGVVKFAMEQDTNWKPLYNLNWYIVHALSIFGVIIILLPVSIFFINYESHDLIFLSWLVIGMLFWTGNAKHDTRYIIQLFVPVYYLALLPLQKWLAANQ